MSKLREILKGCTMSMDTFSKLEKYIEEQKSEAFERGAWTGAGCPMVNEHPNTRPNIEARIGDPAPNAGDESVGVIYEVLDSKLPESFIRCGFVNGMQRGSFQGRSYEYLSADGVNPARWVLVDKESV